MGRIFEAAFYHEGRYQTLEDVVQVCIDAVEAAGEGRVTLFHESPNLPGMSPSTVQKSMAMWRYQEGKWHAISIHTGVASELGEEKPHL